MGRARARGDARQTTPTPAGADETSLRARIRSLPKPLPHVLDGAGLRLSVGESKYLVELPIKVPTLVTLAHIAGKFGVEMRRNFLEGF